MNLVFKSNEDYFEYFCKYMDCAIREKESLPALVLDATKVLDAKESVSILPNGCQMLAIKVADDDGGFVIVTETLWAGAPLLVPGDLVAWEPMKYAPELEEMIPGTRYAWIGFVVSLAKPEVVLNEPRVL
jgi:hypothetical protein